MVNEINAVNSNAIWQSSLRVCFVMSLVVCTGCAIGVLVTFLRPNFQSEQLYQVSRGQLERLFLFSSFQYLRSCCSSSFQIGHLRFALRL